jgi:hypothetical protein
MKLFREFWGNFPQASKEIPGMFPTKLSLLLRHTLVRDSYDNVVLSFSTKQTSTLSKKFFFFIFRVCASTKKNLEKEFK